jgi:hypothetical protein
VELFLSQIHSMLFAINSHGRMSPAVVYQSAVSYPMTDRGAAHFLSGRGIERRGIDTSGDDQA